MVLKLSILYLSYILMEALCVYEGSATTWLKRVSAADNLLFTCMCMIQVNVSVVKKNPHWAGD